jgi:hypothetical protein
MDHDSANLDSLLQVLLWIGCALFIALVWSGYQLYCTNRLESRQSMRLTTLHRKQAEKSSRTKFHGVTVHQKEQGHAPEPVTPRIDNRSRSRIDFATKPITPTRLDFSSVLDEASPPFPAVPVATNSTTATFDNGGPSTVLHKIPQGPTTAVAPNSAPLLLAANINPHNPFTYLVGSAGILTKDCPSPQTDDRSTTDSLSPTTKLAQTWTARKSIRRRARKIKSTQPLATTPSGVLFSKMSRADSIPVTNKEQASPLLLAPIPDLVCSTPGSADSFVEEYW